MIITIGLILILVLVVIGVYLVSKTSEEKEKKEQVILSSGIYSVLRPSPRLNIQEHKPPLEEIETFLKKQELKLPKDKQRSLLKNWQNLMEENLKVIETGDKSGIEQYIYLSGGEKDKICGVGHDSHCISRQSLYKNPAFIPPFHLHCRCRLKSLDVYDWDKQRIEIKPESLKLPDWKSWE